MGSYPATYAPHARTSAAVSVLTWYSHSADGTQVLGRGLEEPRAGAANQTKQEPTPIVRENQPRAASRRRAPMPRGRGRQGGDGL